jgi:hypothetical protein
MKFQTNLEPRDNNAKFTKIVTLSMALTLLLFFIFSTVSKAQTIRLDTAANMAYVNIDPLAIGWHKQSHNVTRLYVHAGGDNLVNFGTIKWFLKYPVVVDQSTTNYITIADGQFYISGRIYANWDEQSKFLFRYAADSLQDIKVTISE